MGTEEIRGLGSLRGYSRVSSPVSSVLFLPLSAAPVSVKTGGQNAAGSAKEGLSQLSPHSLSLPFHYLIREINGFLCLLNWAVFVWIFSLLNWAILLDNRGSVSCFAFALFALFPFSPFSPVALKVFSGNLTSSPVLNSLSDRHDQ